MQIIIREMDRSTVQSVKKGGNSFEVRAKLLPSAENEKISYTIVDVPPYIKQYGLEEVEPNHRRQGVGRALMGHAIEWARAKGCPGMMLETQNNNVAGCCLYASCGFELRGFDTHLYKALDPSTDEIALYWYLTF